MIKLTFKRDELLKALDHCSSSIEKKHAMPILGHVLFKFKGNECTLNATNLETTVMAKIIFQEPVDEGKIAVPAKYIHDICKVARGENILFKYDTSSNILDITAEKSKYTVPCADANDFPSIPSTKKTSYSFEIGRLINSFKKLQFSMTEHNVNKAYSGVLIIKVKDGDKYVIEMVTTDIHRISVLTLKNFSLDIEGIDKGIVISGKNFTELSKIFSETEKAEVAIDDDKMFITGNNVIFISRLLKNEFPNYRTVIGGYAVIDSKDASLINRKELVDGVKRVIALNSEEKIWATKFDFKGSVLSMTASSNFGGNSNDEILVEKPFNIDKSVGINARYLLDVLSVLDKQQVSIIVEEGLKPLTIKEETDNFYYVHMVMPLRM